MPWVRFDDQFPINRKVTRLSDAAYRLHTSAIFWCARNLTDGLLPEEDLEDVCARVRTPERFVAELLGRGLWHEIGAACDSETCPAEPNNAVTAPVRADRGWLIHDYLEFQPSKDQVLVERAGNAARQKKWRERQKEKRNAVSNAVSNGVSNGAPSRPVPKTDSTSLSGAQARDDEPEHDSGDTAHGAGKQTAPAAGKTSHGSRLPDDFPLTAEMIAWARENTPTCGTPDHEAFCDYWRGVPGTKGRKLDWAATWRNWMRKEHKERASRNGNSRRTGASTPTTTSPRNRWLERE